WCFVGDAVSFTAVIAGLWMMRTEELRLPPAVARGRGQVRAGLSYVWKNDELRIPLLIMTIVGTLAFNFSVVLPLFVKRTLDGSDAQFTLLFSALSVGSVIGALWSAQREVVRLRHIVLATFAFGVTMIALAGMPTLTAA